MDQLVQSLKDGKMEIAEVPYPALNQGCILVRNHFSMISTGTEGKTVSDARAGIIGKAKARKAEVKKVIQSAKTKGILTTYKMVMNKLETPTTLGYCSAGEVLAVATDITDIKVGDIVACGGNNSNHAEVIAVPRNLCSKVPPNVSTEVASMTTMGAIALQGIRQADLRLGENCVVIGLGLLGQLTMQLLESSGVSALGVDIDLNQVNLASKNGLNAHYRNNDSIIGLIQNFSDGFGTDAVIITAGTNSTDPINFAGEICRQKGKVIVVGAVPTGFERQHYFKKELELKMSCSYGPGRYDSDYELKGIDYPIGYVRWTENRNMMSFLSLAAENKIDPARLISHRFNFKDCISAYDLITQKSELFLGIVLKYDLSKQIEKNINVSYPEIKDRESTTPIAGIIGAGSFARNILLPAISKNIFIQAISTSKPNDAKYASDKYHIPSMFCEANSIFTDAFINTIFISTRHDSHFGYVMNALKANKNVYVEKPLCLSEHELNQIARAYGSGKNHLMVGFNRRFSPLIQTLATNLEKRNSNPVSINYRINAGILPPSHWVHDLEIGGGRIIGEVCHFIDLTTFITRSKIQSVSAVTMYDSNSKNDTVVITLAFANGSIASISYFSNGNNKVGKEYLEVYYDGNIAMIDDFNLLQITGNSKTVKKTTVQNKGHHEEITSFINSIKNGMPEPIPFHEIYHSMLVTFKCYESIQQKGARIFIDNQFN